MAAHGWENFFVAEVGAAAALSGLVFVAVSINLSRILAIDHLPDRAAETLVVLVGVLVVASFGLVPEQSFVAFGGEVAATGAVVWAATVKTQVRAYQNVEARQWLFGRVVATQVATLPFLAGGAMLLAGREAGLYWVVAGVLLSFACSIQSAWVLLVEIMR